MPKPSTKKKNRPGTRKSEYVSLKTLSKFLKLSPTTISLVLNKSEAADSIPPETKERVFAAAQQFNYRPNFFARSLRNKRTMTIGVLIQDIGEGYGSLIIGGIEHELRENQYLFLLANHHHRPELLDRYVRLLIERGVEGFIVIDTELKEPLPLPTVAVSGPQQWPGVTNITVDHEHAAQAGLRHLLELGHSRIVFIKGQTFSSDSEERWACYMQAAREMGVTVQPDLCINLEDEDSSPLVGYTVMQRLLKRTRDFTAVFAYNDISAIGSMRALNEVGLRVPQDVSVVGFDDIQSAAFHSPSLTTVRQPLRKMGQIAASVLLERLGQNSERAERIAVEPLLIVRESTAPATTNRKGWQRRVPLAK